MWILCPGRPSHFLSGGQKFYFSSWPWRESPLRPAAETAWSFAHSSLCQKWKEEKKRKINLFSISLNGKRCNLAIQGNSVSSSEEHQWPGYYSQIQEITVVGSERNPFLELVVFLSCVLVPCPSQAVDERGPPAGGSYSRPTSEKPGLCVPSICDVLQVTRGAPAMPHS